MKNIERRDEWRRDEFQNHFGHLDVAAQRRLIELVREGYLDRQTVDFVANRLQAEMLITPGNNDVAMDQLSAALFGYLVDKNLWDQKIRAMKGLE